MTEINLLINRLYLASIKDIYKWVSPDGAFILVFYGHLNHNMKNITISQELFADRFPTHLLKYMLETDLKHSFHMLTNSLLDVNEHN